MSSLFSFEVGTNRYNPGYREWFSDVFLSNPDFVQMKRKLVSLIMDSNDILNFARTGKHYGEGFSYCVEMLKEEVATCNEEISVMPHVSNNKTIRDLQKDLNEKVQKIFQANRRQSFFYRTIDSIGSSLGFGAGCGLLCSISSIFHSTSAETTEEADSSDAVNGKQCEPSDVNTATVNPTIASKKESSDVNPILQLKHHHKHKDKKDNNKITENDIHQKETQVNDLKKQLDDAEQKLKEAEQNYSNSLKVVGKDANIEVSLSGISVSVPASDVCDSAKAKIQIEKCALERDKILWKYGKESANLYNMKNKYDSQQNNNGGGFYIGSNNGGLQAGYTFAF